MSKNHESTTTKVAKVNNIDIVIVENGEKLVPIKPICQALNIDEDAQRRRLKEDPILSSVTVLNTATGADGKQYEMVTIPLKFVFGWLFRIDSRNVKEEAREAVLRYQVECYNALFDHFARQSEFLEARQRTIDSYIDAYDEARSNFKFAERIMRSRKEELDNARGITFADWLADQSQLKLFQPDEMEG